MADLGMGPRPKGAWAAALRGLAGVWIVALALGPSAATGGPTAGSEPDASDSHTPLTVVEGRLRAVSPEAQLIPEVTAYCNSCHGAGPEGTGTSAAAHPDGSAALDHPVDSVYPQADPSFRAPADLDAEILLLGGRVTCVSCHAHDDPRHGPVLPTDGSALCRACHLR